MTRITDSSNNAELFNALLENNAVKIAELIHPETGRFSPNCVVDDCHGISLLNVAVHKGFFECVKAFVEASADIDWGCPCSGFSPLMTALAEGNVEIFIYLFKKGAAFQCSQSGDGIMSLPFPEIERMKEFLMKDEIRELLAENHSKSFFDLLNWLLKNPCEK